MKKLYISFLLLISMPVCLMAQDIQHVTVQYSMGYGVGNTHDFISRMSFRGVSIDYKNFGVSDKVALGFDLGWNTLYMDRDYASYTSTDGSTTVSGKQYRYLNSFPILLTADYFFQNSDSYVRPFAGLGVGTIHSIKTVDMGLYSFESKDWHFGIKPQAGVWVGFDDATQFTLSAEYLYGFKTKDVDALQYLTLNVGFVFTPQ